MKVKEPNREMENTDACFPIFTGKCVSSSQMHPPKTLNQEQGVWRFHSSDIAGAATVMNFQETVAACRYREGKAMSREQTDLGR